MSVLQVENSLEELNSTILYHQQLTDLHFLSIDSAVSNISQRVSSLESNLLLLNQSERRENVSGLVGTSLRVDLSMLATWLVSWVGGHWGRICTYCLFFFFTELRRCEW